MRRIAAASLHWSAWLGSELLGQIYSAAACPGEEPNRRSM
jgi:hypothetical protein